MGVLGKARSLARVLGAVAALGLTGPVAGKAPAEPAAGVIQFAAAAVSAASHQGEDDDPAQPRAALRAAPSLRDDIKPDPSAAPEPFIQAAPESPPYASKWRAAAAAMAADLDVVARCRAAPEACSETARRFIALVHEARDKDGRARLGEVNRAVNLAIRFTSDAVRHGGDVWTSPLATLSAGRGDCEDYAILKLMALRDLGIAGSDLRLVVLRDLRLQEDHAVVTARLGGRWIVLDNRHLALLDAEALHGRTALAAFGEEGDPGLATVLADNAAAAARRIPVQTVPVTVGPSQGS